MFKNSYFKEIIPDIILAAGIIILVTGVFFLTGFDYLLEKGFLPKEENQAVGFGPGTANKAESAMLGKEQGKDKKEILEKVEKGTNTGKKIIDSELLLTIQDKPELLKNCFSKDEFSVGLAIESFKSSIKDNTRKRKVINILIPEGSSGLGVARILDESDLITYQDFKQLLLLFDIETRIRAGSYSFKDNSSVSDILTKILLK